MTPSKIILLLLLALWQFRGRQWVGTFIKLWLQISCQQFSSIIVSWQQQHNNKTFNFDPTNKVKTSQNAQEQLFIWRQEEKSTPFCK